jgi:hypothetical protein
MSDSAAVGAAIVSDTFRNLVAQFNQELCFYRELIQNALDAGSGAIDVQVAYDDDRSVAVAHVIDSGSGMDRAIIDSQLTRLFSSSKEGDFTQIGKFGIGFVSVFAIQPEAVVVDTARSGECWRVIFTADGRFERIELDGPMEGTHVQVYKPMPRAAFADFAARSRATVEYWCRHAEAEIRFNGERVDVPFDLDAPIKAHATLQGTEIVAALVLEEEPFFGFYNGGITLLEGRRAWVPQVAFKIKSRYLEHTLTRDNVKQDENFDKAMRLLDRVVDEELMTALRARLLGVSPDDPDRREVLQIARAHLARVPRDLAFLPTVGGGALSTGDLKPLAERTAGAMHRLGVEVPPGAVLVAEAADPLTAAVDALGARTLRMTERDPLGDLLIAAGWKPLPIHAVLGLPLSASPSEPLRTLTERAATLLRGCGVGLPEVRFASFDYPHSAIAELPFVLQQAPGQPCPVFSPALLGEDQAPSFFTSLRKPQVVLNLDHRLVHALANTASPRLAAYLLAKLLCLSDGLHPETERRLLEAVL